MNSLEKIPENEERYMDVAARMNLLQLGPGAGTVYWKPAGLKIYEALRRFIRDIHEEHGYQEVKSPGLVSVSLFEQSGHLGRYSQNMFFCNQQPDGPKEAGSYALRPMSCPNHIVLYQGSRRSYRELPLQLFEFGEVFRNEPDGSLQVLFRQRQFCQDDSHIFAADSQVADSALNYLEMAKSVYSRLGFDQVEYAISTRPAERFGEDELWDKAEEALREACRSLGVNWKEQPGEGAFYGPKIELGVRDKLGRLWQMGTFQLDYVLPRRFGLEFQLSEGGRDIPVLLHHAVLGSLERMVGILLEVHGVALPEFLHPYPAAVVPVSEKSLEYAKSVFNALGGPRKLFLEDSSDPLGAKIRRLKNMGVSAVYVVGEAEAKLYAESGEMWAVKNSLDGSKEKVKLA